MGEEIGKVVGSALDAGYRHINCMEESDMYTGNAINAKIKEGVVKR